MTMGDKFPGGKPVSSSAIGSNLAHAKFALVASPTPAARAAEQAIAGLIDWVPQAEADIVVALGGDGYMLQTLHAMLDASQIKPVFGMNLGTVGFLMNEWRVDGLVARIAAARAFTIHPLIGEIETMNGERHTLPAINEISLLRETRQAAKLEIEINGRTMIPELSCDGALLSTPAGSTAYNLSARGPILPLDSAMLALTPISPFRPRRWNGAILPDRSRVRMTVLEGSKRPVSAVADQREVRDIRSVAMAVDRTRTLTLLFDPHHALDDRIAAEQFVV